MDTDVHYYFIPNQNQFKYFTLKLKLKTVLDRPFDITTNDPNRIKSNVLYKVRIKNATERTIGIKYKTICGTNKKLWSFELTNSRVGIL